MADTEQGAVFPIEGSVAEGIIEPKAVTQLDAYAAGVTFARTEGAISAPETTHAIATVIDEAKRAKEEGKEKVILFNWSGHGLLDLGGYDKYFVGFGLSV